jgi:hypothetical protein
MHSGLLQRNVPSCSPARWHSPCLPQKKERKKERKEKRKQKKEKKEKHKKRKHYSSSSSSSSESDSDAPPAGANAWRHEWVSKLTERCSCGGEDQAAAKAWCGQ